MRRKSLLILVTLIMLAVLAGVLSAQDMNETTFTVRIENISGQNTQKFSDIGIFGIPVGAHVIRDVLPGEAYDFTVKAKAGDYLSFATMYADSNDTCFATGEDGIPLFNKAGTPVTGDVSDQVALWDVGTEVNEALGLGPDQAPRQNFPGMGKQENGTVVDVDNTGDFPAAHDAMTVTLTPSEFGLIRVHIENHSLGIPVPTLFTPGIFVVHSAAQKAPFFTSGKPDRGQGLEQLCEDGNPQFLAASLAGSAVMDVGASPGNYVVHTGHQLAPFFTSGTADRGQGLEAQAEDGNPKPLGATIAGMGFKQFGIFNTPVGTDAPGPLKPGQAYEFSISAVPGDRLNFVLMFGQSNDLFFAPDENGITLFHPVTGLPISGPITGDLMLWDAGTEVNQEPFVGSDQAPRQAAPNTGTTERGLIQPVYEVNDGFTYPAVLSSLRVTITNDSKMETMAMQNMNVTPEATTEIMATQEMMTPEATPAS